MLLRLQLTRADFQCTGIPHPTRVEQPPVAARTWLTSRRAIGWCMPRASTAGRNLEILYGFILEILELGCLFRTQKAAVNVDPKREDLHYGACSPSPRA
jgi:hypothetical protein